MAQVPPPRRSGEDTGRRRALRGGGEEPFSEEYRLLAKDGSVVWVREGGPPEGRNEPKPLYWQGVFYDLTERKALERRLEHRAFHDYLTDLPNRQLFVGLPPKGHRSHEAQEGRRWRYSLWTWTSSK